MSELNNIDQRLEKTQAIKNSLPLIKALTRKYQRRENFQIILQ